MFTRESKGFGCVCEYKKRSAWFGSFEIRYIVIEDERMKVFKNEKEYVSSKKRHSKPSITVVLRNARLKITSEQRHPHILSIQVRGTHHCLSFVNDQQLKECQNAMTKVIQAANLIRPTIEQQNYYLQSQSNIDEQDVNTKYRAVLSNLGLPSKKIEQLVKTQSFVEKIKIVTDNEKQLNNMNINNVNNNVRNGSNIVNQNIMHWIKILRRPANVTVTNITDISTLLYEEPVNWMISFINEQGLTCLVSIIPHQIHNVKYQIELLQCFKVICDKTKENEKIGLKYIVQDSTAIQGIIDLFDSQDPQVSILIIKLLSVICWHSPEGFEKVIDSLEIYCDNTDGESVWLPIITDLKPMIAEISNTVNDRPSIDNQNTLNSLIDDDNIDNNGRNQFAFEYVLFTMGLINAILNSFTSLEDRVEYRKDLEQLGFDKIVSYLSDLIISMEEALMDQYDDDDDDDIIDDPWIDKMDEHLEMYQAVKLKDMRDSSLDGIDVSNPSDLFEFLDQHCVEDGFLNEFTHILQCLTTIPRNAPYLWSTVEKIVSYSTAPIRKTQLKQYQDDDNYNNIDQDTKERLKEDLIDLEQNPQDAFPSFDQLKVMLSRYDQDLAYMESESSHYQESIALLQEQILNLKYQLSNHQHSYNKVAHENKVLKHQSMTSDTITVQRTEFENVLNNKGDKKKHKRKSSLLDKIGIKGMFKSNTNLLNNGNNDALYDDDEDQLIDVSNAWSSMNDKNGTNNIKSPHSLIISSTTEGTPPPIHTHTLSASSSNHKPRGYATRNDHSSTPTITNTTTTMTNTQGLPSPFSPQDDDDIKNAELIEPGANGVAVVSDGLNGLGGLGGLPPPPLSPTRGISATPSIPGASPIDTTTPIGDNKPVPPVSVVGPPEDLKKYLKMLKMGLPQVAAEHKMRQDGKDPQLLIDYLENGGSIDPPTPEKPNNNDKIIDNNKESKVKSEKSETDTKPKSDSNDNSEPPEKLKKYLKMLKLKIPKKVVMNKMKQNGDNPQELEDWLNPPKKEDKPKDDKPKVPPKELERYLKMLKMKIPLQVVKNKMKQNGDNPEILENWLNPPKKDDKPKEPPAHLTRWLKMHKMKIPLKVILNKMKQNGDNPKDLEDWLNGTGSGSGSKPKPKPKPKNELPPGMKAKPKIKPNKKMRALHWTVVKPKDIKNTIWDGLDESKISIDITGFESQFQQKAIAKKDDKPKSKKSAKDEKKNEEIHLVDGKRSYNVDIGLNRFKLSHQQIKEAILLMDDIVLDLDKVTKLRNYIPDSSEQEILRNFDGDVTLLAHTERFFLALCNIPDLVGRMELWQFKLQFQELLTTQMDRIEILKQSHDNIKNSKSFRIILQYVLAYGNYMNGGTRKGQAFGFKLNSLRQIASAKSVDNKSTLLNYLYAQIEKQHPDALQFINDFEILAEGSRLDTSQLTAEVNKIGGSLRKISKKLKDDSKVKTPRSQHDLFAKKMIQFLDQAQPQYDKLKEDHDKTKEDCTKLAEFFNCKNDIKFEFFKDLYEFSQLFKQTGFKLQKQREKEAKELKNAQIKAARQERLKKKRQGMQANGNGNSNSNKIASPRNGKSNRTNHRRTSSNRASQLYSKNGLNKKRGSIKKGIGSTASKSNGTSMDPQLARMLAKQSSKQSTKQSTKQPSKQSYAQRRQSRNSRSQKRKGQQMIPPPVPTELINTINNNNNGNDANTPITNSNTMITHGTNSAGPSSPIEPISPYQIQTTNDNVNMNGLPPPPQIEESYNENVNFNRVESPSVTESIVTDIKLSEIQARRKASQTSRSKSRTKSKEQNRQTASAMYAAASPSTSSKKKKKKKWFGF